MLKNECVCQVTIGVELALLALFVAGLAPIGFAAESPPIKSVTVGNGYIYLESTGDEWSPTWAEDGNLYTNNDDGSNFGGLTWHRNVAFGKLVGDDPFRSKGTTINPPLSMDYGSAGQAGADGANWKSMNTYCVDGVLYMGLARCFYPEESGDSLGRHRFCNSSIIKSTDHGLTWTRPPAENYHQPMFPGDRFGALYFVWYGQNGAAEVDNADKYVYAISTNGHFEDGDDVVLGPRFAKQAAELESRRLAILHRRRQPRRDAGEELVERRQFGQADLERCIQSQHDRHDLPSQPRKVCDGRVALLNEESSPVG